MPTEADTCRTLITPKLQATGWDSDPRSIAEQRYFNILGYTGTATPNFAPPRKRKLTNTEE